MYAICIECSHKRGMGNLFRSLNIIDWLIRHDMKIVVMLNDDERSLQYLKEHGIEPVVVDLWDYESNWEKRIIQEYGVTVWINDRMATDIRHAKHVKDECCVLCSFDDTGEGAQLTDMNFAAMVFENIEELKGVHVYTGAEYMILNPEIRRYRKHRTEIKNILVTLGGSDTHGVTVEVAKQIKNLNYKFTIVTGFCFDNDCELKDVIEGTSINSCEKVPSLIEYMSHFDIAITGGGITSFEAVASGIPCIIIANERHEEQVGRFFYNQSCAEYLGYHKEADFTLLGEKIGKMNISVMSDAALNTVQLNGLDNVMELITNGFK